MSFASVIFLQTGYSFTASTKRFLFLNFLLQEHTELFLNKKACHELARV